MNAEVEILHVVLLLLALVLSAFFASSETAIMSLQRIRLRHLEETGVRGARRVRRLTERPDRTLATILIGNNLVNTGAAALGTVIAASLVGAEAAVLAATITVTILLLVFGEITPKTVAIRHGERLALIYALPLELLTRLFAPLTALLTWLGSSVAAMSGGASPRDRLSQEEIRTVIMMGQEAGVLDAEASEILRNVLMLERTHAREIMTPRTDVAGLRAGQRLEDAAHVVAERGFTQLPVYVDTLDEVTGVVHAKDVLVALLRGDADRPVEEIMRPALFVPDTKPVSELLTEMRNQRSQIAVIVDEYGGTAGIVTLEDVLEEVVGEITSEYGAERRKVRSIGEREAVVDGTISIADLNDALDLDLPPGDADTLGGLVIGRIGRIPTPGEECRYGGLTFRVLSMKGNRIGDIRIRREISEESVAGDSSG